MNHPKREEWTPYLFGEATGEDLRKLENHLQECQECAAHVESSRRTLARMNQWQVPPKRTHSVPAQLLIKWAVAAAIVLGTGFGLGRWTDASAPSSTGQGLDSLIKASVAAETQQVFARVQGDFTNALAQLETRLARAQNGETRQLATLLVEYMDKARAEDREATQTLVGQIQRQTDGLFLSLRKDLETLATMTDEELHKAGLRLTQLAANTP